MITSSKTLFSEDGSYIVISHSILPKEYGLYTFIIHFEGTPKQLYKLWKEHREHIFGRVLYCIKELDFFKNHSREIEEGLYEYVGKV